MTEADAATDSGSPVERITLSKRGREVTVYGIDDGAVGFPVTVEVRDPSGVVRDRTAVADPDDVVSLTIRDSVGYPAPGTYTLAVTDSENAPVGTLEFEVERERRKRSVAARILDRLWRRLIALRRVG